MEEDAPALHDLPPAFANDTVKALHAEVRRFEKDLQRFADELEENNERVSVLGDHLKNVQHEHTHYQSKVDAKNREIQTEEHLKALTDREIGRLKSDITKIDKVMLDIQDKINSLQNTMFSANAKLEQFKTQMNWNEEELLQWSLAAKQKEEDRAAILKYEHIDNVKLKNLTLKVERASRELEDKKTELQKEVTETQAAQIELDKTADEYRKAHTERQELSRQWSAAVEAMQKRDQAIAAVAEQIANAKGMVRDAERDVIDHKRALEAEQNSNKQLAIDLEAAERNVAKKRTQLTEVKLSLVELENELAAQRNELEKVEGDLKGSKSMNEALKAMREEKAQRIDEFKALLEQTKKQLETEYKHTDDQNLKAQQVNALFKEHVDRLSAVTKEVQACKEHMFKHSHELFTLRKSEADLIAEISASQGTSRNLQARIHELDQRSLKQQEMLYNIEFQVQQLERKVSYASGKRSLEETLELKAKIEQLQAQLDTVVLQKNMVTQQVKHLQDELRAAKRRHDEVTQQKALVNEKIGQLELESDSAAAELKVFQKRKEEFIVEHDLLKLEIKKLREQLQARVEEVLKLESRKLNLELSMREREKEVLAHQEIQRADYKAVEEARHNLALDLKERLLKIDKLKKKYGTIAARLQRGDAADAPGGDEKSQAYFMIAAAQEREELQRQGDQLNADINKTTTEIAQLTNMLRLMTNINQSYRSSFQKVDPHAPEAKVKAELEEQSRTVADTLYKQKRELREITSDLDRKRRQVTDLSTRVGGMANEVSQKDKELTALTRALAEQQAQLERATKVMQQKRQDFRRARGISSEEQTPEEVQAAAAETRRRVQLLVSLIKSFAEDHPGIQESVADAFEELGIRLGGGGVAAAAAAALSIAGSGRGDSARPDSAHSGTGGPASHRTSSRAGSRPGSAAPGSRLPSRPGSGSLPPVSPAKDESKSSSRPSSRRPPTGPTGSGPSSKLLELRL